MRVLIAVVLLAILSGSVSALWVSINCIIWWTPAHRVCPPQWPQQAAPKPADKAEPAVADAARPSFDVVRAEATGDLIIAGRAAPLARVTIETNGTPIGAVVADAAGDWVFQPERPLARGEHSLGLYAEAPGAPSPRVASGQRVAISLTPGAANRPLVALTEDGKPTRVLQKPQEAASIEVAPLARPSAPREAPVAPAPPPSPPVVQAAAEPTRAEAAARLAVDSLDLEEMPATDRLYARGTAFAGARLMVYVDNAFVAQVTADAAGDWTLSRDTRLAPGTHRLRIDHIEVQGGSVLARAEVTIEREVPAAAAPPPPIAAAPPPPIAAAPPVATAPPPPPVATAPPPRDVSEAVRPQARADITAPGEAAPRGVAPPPPATATPELARPAAPLSPAPAPLPAPVPPEDRTPSDGTPNAGREASRADASGSPARIAAAGPTARRGVRGRRRKPRAIVIVRSGDTLWHISERFYGAGRRYTKIFRGNRAQISDPDRIFPEQRFVVPR